MIGSGGISYVWPHKACQSDLSIFLARSTNEALTETAENLQIGALRTILSQNKTKPPALICSDRDHENKTTRKVRLWERLAEKAGHLKRLLVSKRQRANWGFKVVRSSALLGDNGYSTVESIYYPNGMIAQVNSHLGLLCLFCKVFCHSHAAQNKHKQ